MLAWPRHALTAALAAAAALPPVSAHALKNCGSLDQPVCVETPPPGVELVLTPEENPQRLAPLTEPPSADRPLWPRVRGHKPYGFNATSAGQNGTTLQDEVFLHEQIGASMARVGADWAMIQYYPNLGAGGRPWAYETYLDPQYRAYIRRGIRPILTIMRAPRRFTIRASTRANSKVVGCGTSDACWNPPRSDATEALAIFARDLAKRYPLAAGIEFWNEPNLSNPFWGGEPPNPVYYSTLLDIVHDQVKLIRPNMPILGGALANFAASSTDANGYQRVAQRGYLAEMLRAGAAANMDAVAYHPYLGSYPTYTDNRAQQDAALFQRMLANDKMVLGAYAYAGRPMEERIVATEFGASTSDGYTEERQSAWLTLQLHLWDVDHRNLPLASRTDAAFVHAAVEDLEPAAQWQAGFGLVRVKDAGGRFVPKPAYCSFRTTFGGFSTCPDALDPAASTEAGPVSALQTAYRKGAGRMRRSRTKLGRR